MKHFKPQLAQEIIKSLNLKGEQAPDEVEDFIQLTYEVNPKLIKNLQTTEASCVNATSATLLSANANVERYIVGYIFSMIKDATSTSTSSFITFYQNGVQKFFGIKELTLTAQQTNIAVTLPHPIKIDQNTAISIGNGTNVANISLSVTLFYYDEEEKGITG